MKGKDLFFGITAIYKWRKNVLQKRDNYKERLIKETAFFETLIMYFIIIIFLGVFCYFCIRYETPVVNNFMEKTELKYLFFYPKFDINDINSNFFFFANENESIPFTIESEVDGVFNLVVYTKPTKDNIYTPSLKYTKSIILNKNPEYNKQNIEIIIPYPYNEGNYELCIIIEDKSFFSLNSYNECPSVIHVTQKNKNI